VFLGNGDSGLLNKGAWSQGAPLRAKKGDREICKQLKIFFLRTKSARALIFDL